MPFITRTDKIMVNFLMINWVSALTSQYPAGLTSYNFRNFVTPAPVIIISPVSSSALSVGFILKKVTIQTGGQWFISILII